MRLLILTSLLPLALSIPVSFECREAEQCSPASYIIYGFEYSENSLNRQASILFGFLPTYNNYTSIDDPATAGAICNAVSANGELPNETECTTGRANLLFDLRAPQEDMDYQIVHSWHCNGEQWQSSTQHKINTVECSGDHNGTWICTSPVNTFTPENVQRVCAGPTC